MPRFASDRFRLAARLRRVGLVPPGRARRGAERVSGAPRNPDPLSTGIAWAYRLTSVGLEFCLPALAGLILDRRWGSKPWATLAGAVLGFGLGMYHLLRMTAARPSNGGPPA